MAKSPNKHNRIYAKSIPMDENLSDDIERGKVGAKDEPKERAKYLADTYDWDKSDALKLWSFGPDNQGPNVLVDATKGIQYMAELRDSMESAFQWVTKEGVLTEENMRGVRFNLLDCVLHTDAIHRGGG